jgi:Protein of unknown function (DUF2516)
VTPPFARGEPAGPRVSRGPVALSGYPRGVVFQFESMVSEIAFFVILAVKVWAFVDALLRPAEAYVAAGKLTKQAWLLILGLTVATALVWPSVIGLLSIVGIVAAFVYILDVRPALASITRRR